MLMPKRVKRRRVHRGRMKGVATKGNTVTYGKFGLVAEEPAWIDSKQIEAKSSHISQSLRSEQKLEWDPERVLLNIG